jgi:hypothetical protein
MMYEISSWEGFSETGMIWKVGVSMVTGIGGRRLIVSYVIALAVLTMTRRYVRFVRRRVEITEISEMRKSDVKDD